MNKKIIKLFLINTVLLSILSFGNVYAETKCEDISSANNLTAKYETKYEANPKDYNPCPSKKNCDPSEYTVEPAKGYYYEVIIEGLTNNMRLEISDDEYLQHEGEEQAIKEVESSDFVNNSYTYESFKIFYPVNHTIKVFDKQKNCLIKELKVTTPYINEKYEANTELCKKLTDYKNCKVWINNSISNDDFYKGAIEYAKKNNIKIYKQLPDKYISNNILSNKYVKVLLIIIAIIFVILIFIILKKRKLNKKKILLIIITLFSFVLFNTDVKADYTIHTKNIDGKAYDYYWMYDSDGNPINVGKIEYIKSNSKYYNMYCISPTKNAGKSVNLTRMYDSYKCINQQSQNFNCSAIYILTNSNYNAKSKLIALRLLASKHGALDGDGVWTNWGGVINNVYSNTRKRIDGTGTNKPYWQNYNDSKYKTLYKNSLSTGVYNFTRTQNYTLYKATPTEGNSYQKYYLVMPTKVQCNYFNKKKFSGYIYDGHNKNGFTKFDDTTIKNNCFKKQITCSNSKLTNNLYYHDSTSSTLYRRKSNYKSIHINDTNQNTVINKCFDKTTNCSDLVSYWKPKKIEQKYDTKTGKACNFGKYCTFKSYSFNGNDFSFTEANNQSSSKTYIYKGGKSAFPWDQVVNNCYNNYPDNCDGWSKYWMEQNKKKTYDNNGDNCFKVENGIVKTTKNGCKQGYTYTNNYTNFSFKKPNGNQKDYTFKDNELKSNTVPSWDSVRKKCYITSDKTCESYKLSDLDLFAYGNELYKFNDNNKNETITIENPKTSDILKDCYEKTNNNCIDWATYWKPLNKLKVYYDNGKDCYEYDEDNNKINVKSRNCNKYSYDYNISNKYKFTFKNEYNFNFTFMDYKNDIKWIYEFQNDTKYTTISKENYKGIDFLNKDCYKKRKMKCSENEYVKNHATYKDSNNKIHKRKSKDKLDKIEVNNENDYKKCYGNGITEKKSCASSKEDLINFTGTFTFDSTNEESYFDKEKYDAIKDTETKKNYLQTCKCSCSSSAADINAGCSIENKSGNWNKDIYNNLDDNHKESYNNACPPCNFEKEPQCTNEGKLSCSNSETTKEILDVTPDFIETTDPEYVISEAEGIIDEINSRIQDDDNTYNDTIGDIKNEIKTLKDLNKSDDKDEEKIETSVGIIRDNISNLLTTYNKSNNSNNNGDYIQASYKFDIEDDQINACLSTVDQTNNYNFKDIYGIDTICKDEYFVQYSAGKIDTGINTSVGISSYLNISSKTLGNDNTLKVKSIRTCYLKSALSETEKNNISYNYKNKDFYANAPKFSFEYGENIENNGFKPYYGITKLPQFDDKKIIFEKIYEYEPSTEFYVHVANGKFYYKDYDNKFTPKDLIEYNGQELVNKIGNVFPIKFTTSPDVYDGKGDIKEYINKQTKNYTINLDNYNISDKAINYKDKDNSCKNSYSCNYIISKKTCSKEPCQCVYVCMKNVPENEKANSSYCSEVCYPTSKVDPKFDFVYTTVSTDNLLNSDTTTLVGQNWDRNNKKASDTIKKIEETSQKGETFADKNLVYEIELTPSVISCIKGKINNSYVGTTTKEEISSNINTYKSYFLSKVVSECSANVKNNISNELYTDSHGKQTAYK